MSFPVIVGGVNGEVVGIDAQTGARVWQHRIGAGGPVELQVLPDRVFAMAIDPVVHCFAYPEGIALGTVPLPRKEPSGRLFVKDGRLFVAGAGQLTCIEVSTGRVLWHQQLDDLRRDIALGVPGDGLRVDRTR